MFKGTIVARRKKGYVVYYLVRGNRIVRAGSFTNKRAAERFAQKSLRTGPAEVKDRTGRYIGPVAESGLDIVKALMG